MFCTGIKKPVRVIAAFFTITARRKDVLCWYLSHGLLLCGRLDYKVACSKRSAVTALAVVLVMNGRGCEGV